MEAIREAAIVLVQAEEKAMKDTKTFMAPVTLWILQLHSEGDLQSCQPY